MYTTVVWVGVCARRIGLASGTMLVRRKAAYVDGGNGGNKAEESLRDEHD